MRKFTSLLFVATTALCVLSPLNAQTPAPKAAAKKGSATSSGSWSPHVTTSAKIDDNRVTLVYGSPNLKDPKNDGAVRKVWGGLVPFGKIWRLGSDEATLLITQKAIDDFRKSAGVIKSIGIVAGHQLGGEPQYNAGRSHFKIAAGVVSGNVAEFADGPEQVFCPFRLCLAIVEIQCKWIDKGCETGFAVQ